MMLDRLLANGVRSVRSRRGAAALEFALIASPFVFMLFAIIESGLIFITQISLSNATMSVARQIRTGNLRAAGSSSTSSGATLSLTDFKIAICNSIKIVPTTTCLAQLQIDLRAQQVIGSSQTASIPIVNLNFTNSGLCYYSGQSGSVVKLRAFYLWQINTPILLSALVNATSYTVGNTTVSGKFRVLSSGEAFRVEQNSSGNNNGPPC